MSDTVMIYASIVISFAAVTLALVSAYYARRAGRARADTERLRQLRKTGR